MQEVVFLLVFIIAFRRFLGFCFLFCFGVFLLLLDVWGFGGVFGFSRIRNLMVVGIGGKCCTLGKSEHAHPPAFVPTPVSAASQVRVFTLSKKVTQNSVTVGP